MKCLRYIAFLPVLIGTVAYPGLLCASGNRPSDAARLEGKAEDLWGNQLNLSKFGKGVTLIHPFSPANCGYCLVDGEFVRETYFRNNEETGGTNFLQCLFNPQLDIYTYQKHYRECSTPVLTFPIALHNNHQDGFPFIIAFENGKLVHQGNIDYEETFQELRSRLWATENPRTIPTSPMRMATCVTDQNETELTLYVYSDKDKANARGEEEWLEKIKKKWGTSPGLVKHESQIEKADYGMNLYVKGKSEEFNLGFLKSTDVPIQIDSDSVRIGDHKFPKSEVSVSACFPNPHNTEKYVVLDLKGSKVKSYGKAHWVDYKICGIGSDGRYEILLEGLFEKDRDKWRFSPALAYGKATGKKPLCTKVVCPIPSKSNGKGKVKGERQVRVSSWIKTPMGRMKTFGAGSCRFPSLALDDSGVCWAAWEEDGDIFLASVNRPGDQIAVAVESDSSDSFNPVLAHDGSVLWVFYLNDRDRFYRLCARRLDGGSLSDEILVTERGPFNVFTPGVASDGKGKLVIAWTEWKANFRYLKFREIGNRSLGAIKDAAVKEVTAKGAEGYINAWYPSLVMDTDGQPWGAWNQHYPAIVGVCAGNLVEEAGSVTNLGDDILTSENGGYPSIVLDESGKKWVFWESFAWDVYLSNKPQRILGSWYDEANKQWSLPYLVSSEEQTVLNQTPRAVLGDGGAVWIAWSGRKNDIREPWGIHMARFDKDRCSVPRLISKKGVNARAPAISAGDDGTIWLAWHSGIGDRMQVKVLEYRPQAGDFEERK